MIFRIGFAIYAACVDFMLRAADLLGVTYRDTNAFMFFVLWPAVTVILAILVLAQARTLRALAHQTSQRSAPARTILLPSLHENAAANSDKLESGPLTR